MAIRVFLANNYDVVREGLKSILNRNSAFSICGEYSGNVDLINYIEKVRPSLLFFDVSSNDNIIINNLTRIKMSCPKILIISIIYIDDYNFYCDFVSLEGINGFLSINFKIDELLKGISTVLSNRVFIQDSIRNVIMNVETDKKTDKYKINSLTKRELEILIQVANGMFNKEIAMSLRISERTVKNHMSSIFKKLEVSDRTQAAVFAIKNNIVSI